MSELPAFLLRRLPSFLGHEEKPWPVKGYVTMYLRSSIMYRVCHRGHTGVVFVVGCSICDLSGVAGTGVLAHVMVADCIFACVLFPCCMNLMCRRSWKYWRSSLFFVVFASATSCSPMVSSAAIVFHSVGILTSSHVRWCLGALDSLSVNAAMQLCTVVRCC